MTSFARRTLRTTAAAAGIAALGTGLAGNAVAAPATDRGTPTPESAPSLQGVPSVLPLAGLPSAPTAPSLTDLPMLFVFEGPTVNTAGPAPTPGSNVDVIANSHRVVGSDTTNQQGFDDAAESSSSAADRSSAPTRDGALSALDTAGMFQGLDQGRLVDPQGFDVNTERSTDLN